MTSTNLKHAIWLVMAMSAAALAAGGPPSGGGGGGGGGKGGGGKPTSEATNNLSVPAIMVTGKGAFSALACGDLTDLLTTNDAWPIIKAPVKPPVHYPYSCADTNDGQVCVDEGFYYVQRQDTWQAPCMVVGAATAAGAWGDNLSGSASLKVGSPIRVELVLWDFTLGLGQPGYKVIKLEPAELDRVSDYGHLADGQEGGWSPHEYVVGTDEGFGTVVHDPGATLKIQQVDGSGNAVGNPVFEGAAGGEINATGKIVYGYSLRVTTAGTYRITYTLPKVTLSGCDEPRAVCEGNSASINISVGGGGGGGGGGKPTKPGK